MPSGVISSEPNQENLPMAKSMIRSAAAAVCAVAVLALSSQVPAQNAPAGQTATSRVKNVGAKPVLKTAPITSVKSCPTGYQGTPPNCVKNPQWDVTKNKRS
jgi:hypothetical protein